MRLYASNAKTSRTARRHARLNRPMPAIDITATGVTGPRDTKGTESKRREIGVPHLQPQTARS